eukprot:8222372-Alexandrium_andersonii.AAC.1
MAGDPSTAPSTGAVETHREDADQIFSGPEVHHDDDTWRAPGAGRPRRWAGAGRGRGSGGHPG